jgi:two-component system chemotaxis response regulator CheB
MVYFCEECGERLEQATERQSADMGHLRCASCGEMLVALPDAEEDKGEGHILSPLAASVASDGARLKVLVVEDSVVLRKAIRSILESDPGLQVAGEAGDGAQALELIPHLNPDVITLDINMPVMDGLTALKHIMIKHPTPTLMFSTLTVEGARESLDALKYGAVDFMNKPNHINGSCHDDQGRAIVEKVKKAAAVRIDALRLIRTAAVKDKPQAALDRPLNAVCAIGAAEGGYGALLKLVPLLRPDLPAAVVVVLYAPETHIEAFARYLDANSPIAVRRAQDGEALQAGTCYLASGAQYLTMDSYGGSSCMRVSGAPFPNRRGAVNMLMLSLSETMAPAAMGVVLSGAGADAAEGAAELMRAGGRVIVQDPDTCLFRDMAAGVIAHCPEAAVLPIPRMADDINRTLTHSSPSH